MVQRRLFGTDGIRGLANVHPMTAETALALGRALAHAARVHAFGPLGASRPRAVVVRDTRLSGPMLEAALAAGLSSGGCDVALGGVLPTPAVPLLLSRGAFDLGVVVSASHNPFGDNGLKVFQWGGHKLSDAQEAQIEHWMAADEVQRPEVRPEEIGHIQRDPSLAETYLDHLVAQLPEGALAGLSVLLDCANGAASEVAPEAFRRLGASVVALAAAPTGRNINDRCGATHPQRLADACRAAPYDLGATFDGDADRVCLADRQGAIYDGDHLLALLALDMDRRGELAGRVVVGTVMANLGLERCLDRHGIRLVRTPVGDRYVTEEMKARGARLGGEQSGHILVLDRSPGGDGILVALLIAGMVAEQGRSLAELAPDMVKIPQVLRNVAVSSRPPLDEVPALRQALEAAEAQLGDQGRILVRYSGTQPMLRIMIEGVEGPLIHELAEELAGLARDLLGRTEAIAGR